MGETEKFAETSGYGPFATLGETEKSAKTLGQGTFATLGEVEKPVETSAYGPLRLWVRRIWTFCPALGTFAADVFITLITLEGRREGDLLSALLAGFGVRQIRRILDRDPQPTPAEALAWMLFTHLPSQDKIEDRAAVAASRLLDPPPVIERSTEWRACYRLAQQPIEIWIDLWAAKQWNAELDATGRSLLPIWCAVASHLRVSDEFLALAERLYTDKEPPEENTVFSSEQAGLPGSATVSAAIDPQRVFAHFAHRQDQTSYRPTQRDRTLLDELLADGFILDRVLAGIDSRLRSTSTGPPANQAVCLLCARNPHYVSGEYRLFSLLTGADWPARASKRTGTDALANGIGRTGTADDPLTFDTWLRPARLVSWTPGDNGAPARSRDRRARSYVQGMAGKPADRAY